MEWGRQKGRVNHFYWYLRDPQWGLCFIKTNAYAPYPTWCWLNGHEWAKRQLTRRGVAFRALDNGFWSCEKPEVLQRVCDTLRPGAVKAFFWRWMGILPSPFTADDRRHGYRYELAFRQLEISDTRVFAAVQEQERGPLAPALVGDPVTLDLELVHLASSYGGGTQALQRRALLLEYLGRGPARRSGPTHGARPGPFRPYACSGRASVAASSAIRLSTMATGARGRVSTVSRNTSGRA